MKTLKVNTAIMILPAVHLLRMQSKLKQSNWTPNVQSQQCTTATMISQATNHRQNRKSNSQQKLNNCEMRTKKIANQPKSTDAHYHLNWARQTRHWINTRVKQQNLKNSLTKTIQRLIKRSPDSKALWPTPSPQSKTGKVRLTICLNR